MTKIMLKGLRECNLCLMVKSAEKNLENHNVLLKEHVGFNKGGLALVSQESLDIFILLG